VCVCMIVYLGRISGQD